MFLRLESKIQKNLLFSLATVCLLFFGTAVHAMEQEENIFSEFLDIEIKNPEIPANIDNKALNKILGVSVRAGNIRKERPIKLNLLVALLSLQSKFCNAVLKENLAYNEWQNATDVCRKFLTEINPTDASRWHIEIELDDGGQLVGTLNLKSTEAITMFLILQSKYTQRGKTQIDDFDEPLINIIKSSANNDIRNLGTAISLYKKTNNFYQVFNHFQNEKITLLHEGNIQKKYLTIIKTPFNIKIHLSYYAFLKNILNLNEKYIQLLSRQNIMGILTDRITKQDKQYAEARDHLCKQYLSIKPELERLYLFAREKLSSSEKMLGIQAGIKGYEIPETIEEPIDIDTLLIEGRPEKTSILSDETLAELKYNLEAINAQYQPEEPVVSQCSLALEKAPPAQEQEQPKKKKKKRKKKKEKAPVKTEAVLKAEREDANEQVIQDTIIGIVKAVTKNVTEEAKKSNAIKKQTPPIPKKKKKRKKRKKNKRNHLQEAFNLKEAEREEAYKGSIEYQTKKKEKNELKKEQRAESALKTQPPEPKPETTYEPASDKSVVAYKTPTHISINDKKNSTAIINLYKVGQENIEPFEFEYAPRINGWFSDPEKQLSIEITHHGQNYNNEEYYNDHPDGKARIIAIHSFAKAVDPYIFEYGFQTTKQTPRGDRLNIVVPGELLMENSHTEYGYFVYGFYDNEDGNKVCYHRTFTKVQQNDFIGSISAEGRDAVTAKILGEFS
ncbi:hypothetical protein KAT92_01650 [Candidatus Babeliales bacterium]|nr:hypothetical protein [Candidatus Babeliales bacterium]